MTGTYRAIVKDGRIKWIDSPPHADEPILVRVALSGPASITKEKRGELMAQALEKLANRGGVTSVENPEKWQRSMRDDRRSGRHKSEC